VFGSGTLLFCGEIDVMAYRLRARESVRLGVKRVIREEIDSAIEELTHGKDRDEAIHDARKSVKRVRGALRLVRFDLGKQFTQENALFRDIGQKLSDLRDSQALLEVFDDIVKRSKQPLPSIRRGLAERKRRFESAIDVNVVVEEAVASLRQAREWMEHWPLHSNGFSAISPGLGGSFRAGRRAFAAAYSDLTPENFHEWRKRAKDHWYHIRLLENLWTPVMQAYEHSLKSLEQRLGDDHNLVVLSGAIQSSPDLFSNKRELDTLHRSMETFRDELREEARNIGERIYGPNRKQFIGQMEHLWEAWKHEAERSWARRALVGPSKIAARKQIRAAIKGNGSPS
jgi:CHAD domain-containing protein